jgi:hypothetical protein
MALEAGGIEGIDAGEKRAGGIIQVRAAEVFDDPVANDEVFQNLAESGGIGGVRAWTTMFHGRGSGGRGKKGQSAADKNARNYREIPQGRQV